MGRDGKGSRGSEKLEVMGWEVRGSKSKKCGRGSIINRRSDRKEDEVRGSKGKSEK